MLSVEELCGRAGPSLSAHANGRLVLHRVDAAILTTDPQALAGMALRLQRYDAAVLPVRAADLSWARLALMAAEGRVGTPIIGLVHGLTAPAINDLCRLGMVDFIRAPLCVDELRIRIQRAIAVHPGRMATPVAVPGAGLVPFLADPAASGDAAIAMHAELPEYWPVSTAGLAAPTGPVCIADPGDMALEAFALASASRCADSDDSFGEAKRRIVERFERAYLLASLAKSSGNIAMAARRSKKHRRAFWALMRKHDIDATPFRQRAFLGDDPASG